MPLKIVFLQNMMLTSKKGTNSLVVEKIKNAQNKDEFVAALKAQGLKMEVLKEENEEFLNFYVTEGQSFLVEADSVHDLKMTPSISDEDFENKLLSFLSDISKFVTFNEDYRLSRSDMRMIVKNP